MACSALSVEAEALLSAGRVRDAVGLLTGRAAAGDSDAPFLLAMWRLSGTIVRRDLIASRSLFGQAAALGHPQAAQIYINFLANGTGGDADWAGAIERLKQIAPDNPAAQAQLSLIGKMALYNGVAPHSVPAATILCQAPDIRCIKALFSEAECHFLIGQADPWLEPSLIIDSRTGRQTPHPVRNSDSTSFPFIEENPAIHALNIRIAAATGTSVAAGEPLQVLRYRNGQEYRPHLDAIAGETNQRVLTVLIYLNEDYSGGETDFPRTGFRFKGRIGDALIFGNSRADGSPDDRTQHAGLPVESGTKLIASRWIRARPFMLTPPVPLLAM